MGCCIASLVDRIAAGEMDCPCGGSSECISTTSRFERVSVAPPFGRGNGSASPKEIRKFALSSMHWLIDLLGKLREEFGLDSSVLEVLVEIHLAEVSGRPLTVTSASRCGGLAQTTGLRHLTILEDRGLIIRYNDRNDRRRCFVRTDQQTRARLINIMGASIDARIKYPPGTWSPAIAIASGSGG